MAQLAHCTSAGHDERDDHTWSGHLGTSTRLSRDADLVRMLIKHTRSGARPLPRKCIPWVCAGANGEVGVALDPMEMGDH